MSRKIIIASIGLAVILVVGVIGCGKVNTVATLSSGTATLAGNDYGFDFSENKIFLTPDENYDLMLLTMLDKDLEVKMSIFINSEKGGRIRDLGEKELDSISIVSTEGYGTLEVYVFPMLNHAYAVRTAEQNFAKIYVTSILTEESGYQISFDWVYQPDGSGNF